MDPLPPLPPPLHHDQFQEVLRCCLEKDPARRFPNVQTLASALLPLASPESRRFVESIRRMDGKQGGTLLPVLPSISEENGTLREAAGQQLALPYSRSRSLRTIGIVATSIVAVSALLVLALSGDGQRGSAASRDGKAPVFGAPAQPSPPMVKPREVRLALLLSRIRRASRMPCSRRDARWSPRRRSNRDVRNLKPACGYSSRSECA